MGDGLRLVVVREDDLSAADHERIRTLLRAVFTRNVALWDDASYWGARPEVRVWLEEPDGTIVAHLDFEPRTIGVGDAEVAVVGIGEVATRPDRQGQGLGRRLMDAFEGAVREHAPAPFGFVTTGDGVDRFYRQTGWIPVSRRIRWQDPGTGEWVERDAPNLILPIGASVEAWPGDGAIDLRGMPW